MPVPRQLLDTIKRLIPPLDGSLHKGQSGRVGVLGGARDYTGAPFFAAISALRLGADLSHVICSPTAAGAIKSYSPDLIVHPFLDPDRSNNRFAHIKLVISRLHAIVIGPGLGREDYMQLYAQDAIHAAKENGLFIVLDADALVLVGENPGIIRGYRRAVITPNLNEFNRLLDALEIDADARDDQKAALISKALGGVTVLQKGASDLIAVDTTEGDLVASVIITEDPLSESLVESVKVDVAGGLKRCGGQGDILAGLVGTALAWGKNYENGVFGDKDKDKRNRIVTSRIPLLAAVAGSVVTRTASRRAFFSQGRAVVTQDMLPEIGKAFTDVFE